jgi:DNA-directed RNA polymerase specialized sigma24 family protein/CheY-like chemotaxis protein
MAFAEKIAEHLPYLRRYARALTGSQSSGDAYVRATLEAALADKDIRNQLSSGRVGLYRCFSAIWNSGGGVSALAPSLSTAHETVAQMRLSQITPAHRQALLLTTLEEFSTEDVGEILHTSSENVEQMVSQALAEIQSETTTDVLIIEDEPLIALQLEGLVSDLGHRVTGTAATRDQAREQFGDAGAGLILADIQLADGSSGIDAVEDLLKLADVPVIFITAYPERLLTGERPEPTYLITKPFREETVRAAISQALFFKSTRALG